MGKSVKTPAPPDPVRVAEAQGNINKETAVAQAGLNAVNQVTPYGNLTYTTRPGFNPQNPLPGDFTATQTLDPQSQRQLDLDRQLGISLTQFGQDQLGRVGSALATPFTLSGIPNQVTNVGNYNPLNAPQVTDFIKNLPVTNAVTQISGPLPQASNTVYAGQSVAPISPNVNLSRLGTQDYGDERQRVEDALYSRATSRLNDRFGFERDNLEARLASQGISRDSDAFSRAERDFGYARNDAYSNAINDAILAGGQEQNRLFGLDLSRAGFNNQAELERFGAGLQAAGFNQGLVNDTFNRSLQAENFNEARFENQFNRNVQAGQFANQGIAQNNAQALQAANFANDAGERSFAQRLAAISFGNDNQRAALAQNLVNANLANAGRQQAIQEQAYLRDRPLNEIAALLGTAPGIQGPSFVNTAQTQIAAPDYANNVYSSYNAEVARAREQSAARNGLIGSLTSLGGSALSTFGPALLGLSERTAKKDIRPLGEVRGIRLYRFKYLHNDRQTFGVMADEMPASAVVRIGSVSFVDYGSLSHAA